MNYSITHLLVVLVFLSAYLIKVLENRCTGLLLNTAAFQNIVMKIKHNIRLYYTCFPYMDVIYPIETKNLTTLK